jgi:DNA primase
LNPTLKLYHIPGAPATDFHLFRRVFLHDLGFVFPVAWRKNEMSVDLELIRSCNPIQDVIGEKYALRKSGTRFTGVEHDSLVVTPNTGFYFWNSRNEHGDVFDFVGRHMIAFGGLWNHRDADQFLESVRWLAQRANIPLETQPDFCTSPAWAERQLVHRLHDALLNSPGALQYVTQTRGWQFSTVQGARIGFMQPDKHSLLADLNLPDHWRSVIQRFPPGMIVYVHTEKSRLTYLSGRSIEGKKHYNPPRELVGGRQPYYNHAFSHDSDYVVVVEGQADAISFAEWGIPALALGGMRVSSDLLDTLRRCRRVFVALDNADDARQQAHLIAQALGGKAYLPQLPEGVKDANEWLAAHHATADDAHAMLNSAKSWLMSEIKRVGQLEGLAQEDAIRDLFCHVQDLDPLTIARFKTMMTGLGISARAFNSLLKTTQVQGKVGESQEEKSEVLNDRIPVLSPALGFSDDLALVTVSLRERMKNDRLNVQPYLVTSTRELIRLKGQQILTINGREFALRVVPEGSEFLMRWRYRDIQRFLKGESVQPGAVFQTVHDLFSTYVDFRSPVESRILALWAIGTYFYTLFPAYPYLALNGPKNSGKSTVLRALQPIAFNMVTTSDPTGPAMFRLIHHTSCTVGIDEAERYHNPRDPGLQQIRQLLNSGYKAGMPAIRLIGDEMKPQAFDVYSPKILAAIAGLEDILASRCITVPMRRTDRKMPLIPPDFDGAELRHQLYTLALTHFQYVRHNFFERPELHSLHNRSAELWSPLVALAALFQEQGGVSGLLGTISEAAAWDEQTSEGKALSEREEAVLQALEIMTRSTGETERWIKAADLRHKVCDLLDYSADQMGHAQWIGHILNHLQLTDRYRRKAYTGGQMYLIRRNEITDMMRRYDVETVSTVND